MRTLVLVMYAVCLFASVAFLIAGVNHAAILMIGYAIIFKLFDLESQIK